MMHTTAYRTGRTAAPWTVILLAALAIGCDLGGILDVDLPGRVAEEALDDATLARVLTNGVIADAECSWNTYSAAASHHSDEWIPSSGNLNMRNWGQRKIRADDALLGKGTCLGNYGLYTPLQTARYQAQDVFNRLAGFTPAVAGKDSLQAITRAYGAFAIVALGEGFCQVTMDAGPIMTKAEVLTVAEQWFTEAMTLAGSTTDIVNMARVGRARARIGLGNWAGAIADASAVPAGYTKNVTRDTNQQRRWNYVFEYLTSTAGGFNRHGSVSPAFRDMTVDANGLHTQNSGTVDPRLRAFTNNQLSFDFATIHWTIDKYASRTSPLPLATYKEAQLYLAEAYAQRNGAGDLLSAVAIIDARHTAAGLPTWTGGATATQAQVISHILGERSRELFAEGGHRLNDMLRYRDTAYNIPFKGEAGSVHPNGVDQTGDVYGDTTCFPLPLVESSGNPNIS